MPRSFVPILFVIGFAMLALGAMPWERYSPSNFRPHPEQVRSVADDSIERALFAEGRLWLLTSGGALWSIGEARRDVRREPFSTRVLDMCKGHGRFVVAVDQRGDGAAWSLRTHRGSGWSETGAESAKGDGLALLQCEADGRLILVTSQRLIEVKGSDRTELPLRRQRVPLNAYSTGLTTPEHVFVGLNYGEFGGGLYRIDRKTGAVEIIERNKSGDLCGGPLNAGCDPVSGVVAIPWKPGCVAASVGLIHMGARGRIAEVCGIDVRLMYLGPCPYSQEGKIEIRSGEPVCTEPFSGLFRSGDKLLTVGGNGVTSLSASGQAETRPLPPLQAAGPFRVNFDDPNLVFVVSGADRRHSLSGKIAIATAR